MIICVVNKLRRCFQYLVNAKTERAKGKYFENVSHKVSNKNGYPKK